jgi:hypothetical protein
VLHNVLSLSFPPCICFNALLGACSSFIKLNLNASYSEPNTLLNIVLSIATTGTLSVTDTIL